jgi:tetratricopeptide (TPR) repeat protein
MHDGPRQLRDRAQRAFLAGNLPVAEAACRKLLQSRPDDSLAHYLLSNFASEAGRFRQAVAHALGAARQASSQGLEHALAVAQKAISVGEYEVAHALAAAVDPTHSAAAPHLLTLAGVFSALDDHDRALACLLQSRPGAARPEVFHYQLGNTYKFLGQIERAADEYERSIAASPGFAYAHWSLAYLGPRFNAPAHVDRIRQLLPRAPASSVATTCLYYALFKELDSAGDYHAAWQALAAGSRIKDALVDYDPGREADIFGKVASAGYRQAEVGAGESGSDDRPIFIVGMPRTGTTLLERILSKNPSVAICGELNDFRMQYKWCSDHWCTGFFDEVAASRIDSVEPALLARRYLSKVAWRHPGRAHFTDKNPGNFMMLGLILSALPQARVLHLRRNPMDSCFSNLKELFAAHHHPYSYSLPNLARHYGNYSRLMASWHERMPGRVLDVNYEQLVTEPEATARKVMDYCGLGFDQEQLSMAANPLPVSTASSVQVREPIHTRNIGAWQHYREPLAPLAAALEAEGVTL